LDNGRKSQASGIDLSGFPRGSPFVPLH